MGCFRFCFRPFNNQKVTPKKTLINKKQQKSVDCEPLHPTKPVQELNCATLESKYRDENDFQLNSSSIKKDLVVDADFHKEDLIQKVVEFVVDNNNNDNKEKECVIGNGEDKMLEKEKEREDEIEENKSLHKESADPVVPEESSKSMFSLSSESRKQLRNAEENDVLVQEESSDSLFSVSVESRKCDNLVKEESSDSLFSVSVGSKKQVNAAEHGDLLLLEESSDSLFSLSVGSRKQEAESGASFVQEDSSGSLFSVSVGSRKQVNEVKIDDNEVEVNSPITFGPWLNHFSRHPDPGAANSVLNPVENLTQWKKAIKATSDTCTDLDDHQKENVSPVQGNSLIPFTEEEPSLKKLNPISKQQKGRHMIAEGSELAVDTSLSSWLIKSDKKNPRIDGSADYTEVSSTSSKTLEDRMVLTAMTIEDLKQHSVTSSFRRSPSCYSPDMISAVRTVGSYLSHTGQGSASTDSGSSHSRMSTKIRKVQQVFFS